MYLKTKVLSLQSQRCFVKRGRSYVRLPTLYCKIITCMSCLVKGDESKGSPLTSLSKRNVFRFEPHHRVLRQGIEKLLGIFLEDMQSSFLMR